LADGDGTMKTLGPTDDGGDILAIHRDSLEVFSKTQAETLPPHRSTDHSIDLEASFNLPDGCIHNLSEFKWRAIMAYIEAHLGN
jgi:hypothetical protein